MDSSNQLDEYEKSLQPMEDEYGEFLEPLTFVDFNEYNELNAKSLRANFESIHVESVKTNTRLETMGHNIDQRFENVDKKFEQVDKKFEQVDNKFEQVEKRFDRIDHELLSINARIHNQRLTRLHQPIKAITVWDENEGKLRYPKSKYFPACVNKFWKLQERVDIMIKLLRFYNFTSWNSWTMYDEEESHPASPVESLPELVSHSSSSSSSVLSSPSNPDSLSSSVSIQGLEDAVNKNPLMAWQEIGTILGLDIDRIEAARREFDFFRQKNREDVQVSKRHLSVAGSIKDFPLSKDAFSREPLSKRVHRPSPPPPKNVLTLEELLKSYSQKAKTESSEQQDRLTWAHNSDDFRRHEEEFRRRNKKDGEPSRHVVETVQLEKSSMEKVPTPADLSILPQGLPSSLPPTDPSPTRPRKKKTLSLRSHDSKQRKASPKSKKTGSPDSKKGREKSASEVSWVSTQPL